MGCCASLQLSLRVIKGLLCPHPQVNQEAIKARAVAAAIEASAAAAVIRAAAQNIKAVAEQKERERDQMQRQRSGPLDSPPLESAGGTAKERAVQVC